MLDVLNAVSFPPETHTGPWVSHDMGVSFDDKQICLPWKRIPDFTVEWIRENTGSNFVVSHRDWCDDGAADSWSSEIDIRSGVPATLCRLLLDTGSYVQYYLYHR